MLLLLPPDHLISLPSSPSQWPLLWFWPSFLSILFQTHMANFCLREPYKYRLDVIAQLRALTGASESFQGQVWFALPFFALPLYTDSIFPAPTHCTDPHLPSPHSTEEVLLLCSSHPRAFVHFASSASFPIYLANPDTLFKSSLKHHNLLWILPWSGLPCWEFWPS